MTERDSALDPLLLVPARLRMLCGLSHGHWFGMDDVARFAEMPAVDIAKHIRTLRAVGYVQIFGGTKYPSGRAFITTHGGEALRRHVAALEDTLREIERLGIEARALVVTHSQKVFEVPAGDGSITFLKRRQMIYAEVDRDDVHIFTRDGVSKVAGRYSLNALQQTWPNLIRIHRKYLVAEEAVQSLRSCSDGSHEVMTEKGIIPVSRRNLKTLRTALVQR